MTSKVDRRPILNYVVSQHPKLIQESNHLDNGISMLILPKREDRRNEPFFEGVKATPFWPDVEGSPPNCPSKWA